MSGRFHRAIDKEHQRYGQWQAYVRPPLRGFLKLIQG